jgi:hypothetical protein
MTPKEKALKLYHKFFQEIPAHPIFDDRLIAKQCVLIAVDEILNEFPKGIEGSFEEKRKFYWEEVKQELQKLN